MPDDARPAGGSPAPAEHELLTRLGKYEIERKLGSGGMGTVFLAKDSDLKRTVALKVLARDRAENPVLVRRFKAEGQAAAYLQHKNIVGVYDSGQIDGLLYIALEFVEGQDVLEIIRKRGVIPVKRSIDIVRQVAEALQHAFEKQIVHRDIKPSNLLIKNDGTVKLADLGLARSIDETLDTSITRVGTTVGTVDYMSPEQARNSKATDIRSDIYSLGCTWYHMLTGVPPYGEGSVTNKLQAHATAPLPDPRSRNERVPEGVVAVLHRMMAKQAKDRYATPAELLEDLNNEGITRSGLNVDVLAALAQPGGHAAQESSSGDIFESQVPFDSVELDTAVQTLRQDALPEHVVFDDEPEDSPPADRADDDRTASDRTSAGRSRTEKPARPLPPRTSPHPEPESPRGQAPPREPPVDRDDPRSVSPRKAGRKKGSSDDVGRPAALPRRQSESERESAASATESSREQFRKRKLPPRAVESPSDAEADGITLDSDRLRKLALGGLAIAVLSGVAYAFSFLGGADPGPDSAQGNAAAAPPALPDQPPVVELQPDQPAGDDANRPDAALLAGEPEDASTAARKSARPIAGAEDFTDLNTKAAREIIPNWLFDVRRTIGSRAPVISVRRPGTPGTGVPMFADALSKTAAGPAIVEFHGDGPFLITSTSLPASNQLVLRAAAGSRPVLVFSARDLQAGESCLRAAGNVTLQGLHLILATTAETPAGIAMIQGGSLAFQDCTLQSVGPGSAGAALIRIEQTAQAGVGGCVLENCHLSSRDCHGVQFVGAAARVIAGNSLFVFEHGTPFVIGAATGGPSAGREVRLLHSTVVAGRNALHLTHQGTDPPASVNLVLRRSNCFAADSQATLLQFVGWPVSDEALSGKPMAPGVEWKSEQSALAGWNAMVRLEPQPGASAVVLEGDSGWQKFWRQTPEGTRLLATSPPLPPRPADADAASLSQFGRSRDSDPGCRMAALPAAPRELVHRVETLAGRPRLPKDFVAFRQEGEPVVFDLTKPGQLNAFLNDRSRCPDGSLVQLRGAGYRAIPALQIENRILHLEFVQAEGAPLAVRLQPGVEADSLITIRGGQVSISNGNFLLPESDRSAFPRTVLEAAGGSLAVLNCTLTGPAAESARLGPLVRWSAGEGAAGMLIRDSVLLGGQTALAVDLSGRILEIENSILASVGDAVAVSLSDAAHPGHLFLASATLGGGQSIFSSGPFPSGEQPVLTVITNDSVALSTSARSPAAMLRLKQAADADRVVWWEDGVGYASPQLARLAVESGAGDARSWSDLWGPGHVLRVCSSETAVVFESPVDSLAHAEPASFRLNPRSLAANWSSTGGFLGATGPSLGAPTDVKAAPAAEKGRPRPQVPQPRPRSVF